MRPMEISRSLKIPYKIIYHICRNETWVDIWSIMKVSIFIVHRLSKISIRI
jgi:hypothetical protein